MAETAKKASSGTEIPILIFLSAGLLIAGLVLPAITIKQMIFLKDTFSVLTGIEALYRDQQRFLAAVVLVFSILFPVTKLVLMFLVWLDAFGRHQGKRLMKWLSYLGKWSMLDVFVVAVTVVIAKISKLADAQARPGIYVFAASIIIAIIASIRLERRLKMKPDTGGTL